MKIDTRPIQWVGVALILGWTGVVALGLPRVAAAIPRETAVEAGQAVTAGGVSVTSGEGWGAPAEAPGILILRKAGAQFTAFPPQPATGDPAAKLETVVDPIRADTTAAWQIGDPQTFTTAAGAPGAYAVALSPQGFIATFVVVSDGQSTQVTVNGTDTDWTTLHDEIVEMAKSLTIVGGGA
jgi:hypothetical protein